MVLTTSRCIAKMDLQPKYPEVIVELIGIDSNAFNIIGAVVHALRTAGIPSSIRDEFWAQATSGDYDNLLQTCMKWVTVE